MPTGTIGDGAPIAVAFAPPIGVAPTFASGDGATSGGCDSIAVACGDGATSGGCD